MSNLDSILNRKTIGYKKAVKPNNNQNQKIFVKQPKYKTKGEILIIVKGVDLCELTLDSKTTEHIIVKALTRVLIKPSQNLIDEYYEVIEINKGACVEFYLLENNWYIVSSDGLKLE